MAWRLAGILPLKIRGRGQEGQMGNKQMGMWWENRREAWHFDEDQRGMGLVCANLQDHISWEWNVGCPKQQFSKHLCSSPLAEDKLVNGGGLGGEEKFITFCVEILVVAWFYCNL